MTEVGRDAPTSVRMCRDIAGTDDNSAVLGGSFNHLRISALDVVNSDMYRRAGFLVRTDPL